MSELITCCLLLLNKLVVTGRCFLDWNSELDASGLFCKELFEEIYIMDGLKIKNNIY